MLPMRKHIIESIKYESYVRLRPSTVCDGVGVFALRPIKKGVTLFAEALPDIEFCLWENLKEVHPNVLNYLRTMCNTTDKGLYLSQTINNINLSYYVNHSIEPNVLHDKVVDKFYTIRDIEEGEEILCIYSADEIDW